jgi:hypothetical protein
MALKKSHEKMLTIPDHKEMQIRTTLRFYLVSVRMTTIKNTNNSKYWQGYALLVRM